MKLSIAMLTSILTLGVTALVFAQEVPQKSRNIESEDPKKTVSLIEEQWLNAINNAHIDTIAGFLADDFVRPAPDSGHFINKPALLEYYRSHLAPQGAIKRRIENLTVSLYGSTALARGVLTTKDPAGHATRRVLFTDVFVQRKGRWQAVSAQENPVTERQGPDQ